MIVKGNDAKKFQLENPRGGSGILNGLSYLTGDKISNKLKGFNVMSLEPGAEIGFHQHVNDEEFYFVVEGKGLVKDNEDEIEVGAGDLIYTPDKEYHGIKNIGDGPLKFVAFIVEL